MTQLFNSGRWMIGSCGAFVTANISKNNELISNASTVTGWGLAIISIFTLAKAVKFLYLKVEEKDAIIVKYLKDSEELSQKEISDLRDRIDDMRDSHSEKQKQ